jgi:hypothetical protein
MRSFAQQGLGGVDVTVLVIVLLAINHLDTTKDRELPLNSI